MLTRIDKQCAIASYVVPLSQKACTPVLRLHTQPDVLSRFIARHALISASENQIDISADISEMCLLFLVRLFAYGHREMITLAYGKGERQLLKLRV